MSNNNGRSIDTAIRESAVRTIGWDSIDSGVDECELKRVDHDDLPILKTPASDNTADPLERLIDIAGVVTRAKRAA